MAGMSFGSGGFANPGSRYTQMLQGMPDTNNGTVAGGLASVLQGLLRGRLFNRDQDDQRAAEAAMAQGFSAQPWVNPDTGVADPKQAPTGGYGGAAAALQNLGPGNEHAGRLTSQLLMSKATQDIENKAQRDRFLFEQGYKPPTSRTRQVGRDTITEEFTPGAGWSQVGSGPMDGPRDIKTIETSEGVFVLNGDGTLGRRLGSTQPRANSTNVTVQGQRYGTIPPGYMLQEGPNGAEMVPVPGGPAARDIKKDDDKAALGARQTQRAADIVLEDVGRVRDLVKGSGSIPVTGMGSYLSIIPGSRAGDVSKTLDTIKSNIGFDKLNAMRQASPTGGALGSVTERELALLQSTFGNLEQSQSQDQFLINLDRLEKVYQGIIHGNGAAPPPPPRTSPAQAPGNIPPPPPGFQLVQ